MFSIKCITAGGAEGQKEGSKGHASTHTREEEQGEKGKEEEERREEEEEEGKFWRKQGHAST